MHNKRAIFKSQFPDAFYMSEAEPISLEKHLKQLSWLSGNESIQAIESPGAGNMNKVLRIKTGKRSMIIKQARPWVEKYPQIEAPVERIEVEARFYDLNQQHRELIQFIPEKLGYDAPNYLLLLEDLGANTDMSDIYKKGKELDIDTLNVLVHYISTLHNMDFSGTKAVFPKNLELKKLNHEHIFNYPYVIDNGINLNTIQDGLQEASLSYKQDKVLIGEAQSLGKQYLGSGPNLLHGDYYPGSWLATDKGIKILDPEFGHFGLAAFDIGVMLAHMLMAQMPKETLDTIKSNYQPPPNFDHMLAIKFCGIEIIRRIIGLAQLPLEVNIEEKKELLATARNMVLNPNQFNLL